MRVISTSSRFISSHTSSRDVGKTSSVTRNVLWWSLIDLVPSSPLVADPSSQVTTESASHDHTCQTT